MASPNEALLDEAIAAVKNGLSQRAASKQYGIPQSTLSRRLKGTTSKRNSKISTQRLSPTQESFVCDWILNEEKAGRAPNRRQVAGFATSILKEGRDAKPLGVRWVDRFLKRNPAIRTKLSNSLESSRVRGSTQEAFTKFFDLLEAIIRDKAIIPANIANMDEHGLQELESRAGKVLGTALTKKPYITSTDTTTWVSIIECGTAEGKRLTPAVIFTGATFQGQWFPDDMIEPLKSWKYTHSLSGWSNSGIALQWLKEVYLPETKPSGDAWRLLVLDEHSSHTADDFLIEAYKNKVQLLFLPPHTSHKTQPLDRSVFAAVKQYFRDLTKDYASFPSSAPVTKQRFLECYYEASRQGVSPRNLRSGFRKTGIWPMNRSVVLDDPNAVIDDDARPAVPEEPSRTRTPPISDLSNRNVVFQTPSKSRDITNAIHTHGLVLGRDIRYLIDKAGKRIDKTDAKVAALEHRVQYLETELASLKPRSKRKVKEGGNNRFARIEEIIEANRESQRPPKHQRTTQSADMPELHRTLAQTLQVIEEHENQ